MMQTDFDIGDLVLYLLDGDIGMVMDKNIGSNEPYYVEWYIYPEQSGWHSTLHSEYDYQVLVPLSG